MDLQKVLLYYGFTPLADPEAIRLWQLELCQTLGIKGRIIVSPHGINGTVGGDMAALKKYVIATKMYPGFRKIDFKWSDGTGNEFARLSVKNKRELVAFGNPDEIKVDENGVVGGGTHLKPFQVNKLVEERGDEVSFFDGRNAYEAKIGQFEGAVIPNVESTHDFVAEIESGKYDHLKERPVITYCTGGIRCEILSAVMINRGFKEVYQLDGGIVRYGQKYGKDGHWKGSLYTFDARMVTDFAEDTPIIGRCEKCEAPTKLFRNCGTATCHDLILLCDSCAALPANLRCIHDKSSKRNRELIG
jgi:UPF0176 protein